MVLKNTGLPEPLDNHADEEITTNEEIIMGLDTDTDEDDTSYDGYTLLPLGPEEVETESDEEAVHIENEPEISLSPIVTGVSNLEGELWMQPEIKSMDIQMDSDKVNEVKQAMSNFTLPSTNIPDWANYIPEELWKQNLMDRLQNINKSN